MVVLIDRLILFASVTISIFLEATPFLLLGSLLGAFVEVCVPTERLLGLLPKSTAAGIGLGLVAGLFLPTCECGVVPIARRFLAKGVPAHITLTYMLAAPVFNPVVLVSTYVAFRGDLFMLVGRLGMVLIPALFLGAFLGRGCREELLRIPAEEEAVHSHHSRFLEVLRHTGTDFLDMGRFLLLGALISALFKTIVPAYLLLVFKDNVLLSTGLMMVLAILLSVCSEADSFVASSLNFFPRIAQLSFISIGPMVDVKLISMYWSVFRRPVAIRLILVPVLIVYMLAVLLGVFFKVGV